MHVHIVPNGNKIVNSKEETHMNSDTKSKRKSFIPENWSQAFSIEFNLPIAIVFFFFFFFFCLFFFFALCLWFYFLATKGFTEHFIHSLVNPHIHF